MQEILIFSLRVQFYSKKMIVSAEWPFSPSTVNSECQIFKFHKNAFFFSDISTIRPDNTALSQKVDASPKPLAKQIHGKKKIM